MATPAKSRAKPKPIWRQWWADFCQSVVWLWTTTAAVASPGADQGSAGDGDKAAPMPQSRSAIFVLLFFLAHGAFGVIDTTGLADAMEVFQLAGVAALASIGFSVASVLQFVIILLVLAALAMLAYAALRAVGGLWALVVQILDRLAWLAVQASCASARVELLLEHQARGRYRQGHFRWSRRAVVGVRRLPRRKAVVRGVMALLLLLGFVLLSWQQAMEFVAGRALNPAWYGRPEQNVTLCFAGNQCDALGVRKVVETAELLIAVAPSDVQRSGAAGQCWINSLPASREAQSLPGSPGGGWLDAIGWSRWGQPMLAWLFTETESRPNTTLLKFVRSEVKAVLPGIDDHNRALCSRMFGKGTELSDIARALQVVASKLPADHFPSTTTMVGMLGGLNESVNAVREQIAAIPVVERERLGPKIKAIADQLEARLKTLATEATVAGLLGDLNNAASNIRARVGRIDERFGELVVVPSGQVKPALRNVAVNSAGDEIPVKFKEPVRVVGDRRPPSPPDHVCNSREFDDMSIKFAVSSWLMVEPPSSLQDKDQSPRDRNKAMPPADRQPSIAAIAERILDLQFHDPAKKKASAPGYYLLVGDDGDERDRRSNGEIARRRANVACQAIQGALWRFSETARNAITYPVLCLDPATEAPRNRDAPKTHPIRIVTSTNSSEFEHLDRDPSAAERRSVHIYACRPKPPPETARRSSTAPRAGTVRPAAP